MAKITYLLGAGASYNACPILENQAQMMISVAHAEISRLEFNINEDKIRKEYNFIDKKYFDNFIDNEYKILWHIGFFGEKAKEYGTVDTYARKLFLNNEDSEYRLLKMSVSVFFDLWENYYYKNFELGNHIKYNKIDNRYKSLFSILLDNDNDRIRLNNDFKFITWNYDLQIEETCKLFLENNSIKDFSFLDSNFLKFRRDINSTDNDVFHLNGHRGFFTDVTVRNNNEEFQINVVDNIEDYWSKIDWLFDSTKKGNAKFDNYIKYAWEHDLNDAFFQKISKILNQTDVLVIIGYSFPAFNRKIDQFLLSKLNTNKIKKIVYQDPNADEKLIQNLFEYPEYLKDKIEILSNDKSLNQFNIPNEFFISQKSEDLSPSYT